MSKITKVAQNSVQSRQRNNWVRGNRNKFNRVVDGFNEGTPWRTERNRYYDFTHYYTDALSFDTDPNHVYSGEAIWRMYIMDKFTPEQLDKDGKWVGGYINDRFHKFPTAGTPANPDVDRFQGNQMGLAPGEKTRKPRPHQYSTERRLEEARGNETYDLNAVIANTKSVVKLAITQPKEKADDKVYNVFKDTLDMREDGIDYSVMLESIAEHYDIGIMHVAEIDKVAQKLRAKHEGIMYTGGTKNTKIIMAEGPSFQFGVPVKGMNSLRQTVDIPQDTIVTQIADTTFKIQEDSSGTLQAGTNISIPNINQLVSNGSAMSVDKAMQELSGEAEGFDNLPPVDGNQSINDINAADNFPVQDVTQN